MPVNNEDGSVNPLALEKVTVPLLALTLPVPRDGALPEIVKVFEPVVSVPDVKVKVPFTDVAADKFTPVELAITKLFTEDGKPFPVD